MKNRLFSFALLISVVGISLAWAQSQVEIEGQATSVGSSQGSASASARAGGSASGRAGGSANGGSMSGFSSSNGKVNGQNVYVVDYAEKSSSASSTDGMQAAAKDHESNYTVTLAKQGSLMMSGMYMDDGKRMMVILAKDDTTAAKVAEGSPLVAKGFCTARVRPFQVGVLGVGAPPMTKTEMVKPAVQPHP
ncbi:MAG: hypothetical protein JNK63_08020 [Chthonomonas sp.]|nr:hypothetical protein [Chthonomonas sp.]